MGDSRDVGRVGRVGRHFVVDDSSSRGARFIICRWKEYAQFGRSHEAMAVSADEAEAWRIAGALNREGQTE